MYCIYLKLSLNIILLIAITDLALNKATTQSSTYSFGGLNYSANLAVDGNNGTDFVVDKCSCTKGGQTNPWCKLLISSNLSENSTEDWTSRE